LASGQAAVPDYPLTQRDPQSTRFRFAADGAPATVSADKVFAQLDLHVIEFFPPIGGEVDRGHR